jgi:hypothetical protein
LIAAGLATSATPAMAANAGPGAPADGQPATCVVNASPNNFIESGEQTGHSSVAFIITVECAPTFAEQVVEIQTPQLFNACQSKLRWYSPTGNTQPGQNFDVRLDDAGNATAVVVSGPSCAASQDLIEADLMVAPYTTVTAQVQISPPRDTQPGVWAFPASAVEDSVTSSVATIFSVEFPSVYAEHRVQISDAELYNSCAGHSIIWVSPDVVFGSARSATITLDNNGNAFVVALAGPSCAPGNTLVQAELTGPPYTTFTTQFTVLSPRVTV